MKATADMYTYRVFWSGEDGAFVASVSEFPSLSPMSLPICAKAENSRLFLWDAAPIRENTLCA